MQSDQLDFSELEGCIPRQSRGGIKMSRIELIVFHAHSTELLKNICQQKDILVEVHIMVVSYALTVHRWPHLLGKRILVIINIIISEVIVEGILRWEAGLLKDIKILDIGVWVDALFAEQFHVLRLVKGPDFRELFFQNGELLQIFSQLVETRTRTQEL